MLDAGVWRISSDSPGSLTDQLCALVADRIARGAIQPGARLPSEREFCERLGISRVTVRRALVRLLEDGLVESSAGRGWYVASGRVSEPPNALISFTAMGAARGLTASSRVLLAQVRTATLDDAERLEIAPGADVFDLERVRLLDGIPVALSRSCLALARAPVLPEVDFATASLYGVLENKCGIVPTRADYAVEAREADEREAELLELAAGDAVLVTYETAYDQFGSPIDIATHAYRGDRYRFRTTLIRPASTWHSTREEDTGRA
jgi:GntR family transcriptional regulator